MKTPACLRWTRFGSLAAVIAVLLLSHSSPAASITWNGAPSGGTWDSTNTNWNTATPDPWTTDHGASNVAIFDTAGLTLNVTAATANGITFTQAATLSGGTLTLAGTSPSITGTGTIGSEVAGSAGFTKAGAGTLTLSGNNSYTGTTTIAPGSTLSISSDANLGTAPATATAGSLVIDSTGTLATTASFTLNSNRGIKIGPSTGTGVGTFDVATGTILTYGGIITSNGASGTGGLTKAGAGTLVLAGANTYTGDTTIAAGTVRLGTGTALPSGLGKGNVAVTGTLDLYGYSLSINGLSGAGTVTSGAAGVMTLSAGGNNQTSTFSGMIQDGSGTLGLTKTGTGTLTLSGNNTFTGGVTINGGILQLANAGALNSTNPNSLTFGPGAAMGTKLQLNGNSVTVSSLATNATPGTVIVENANAAAVTLTINQAGNTTFAGVLQNQAGGGGGVLSLTKSGAGSLTLAGTNTYTGTTTISGGTLALAGGTAVLDTGAVVLTNTAGATLLLSASETIGSLAGGGASGGNVNLQSYVLTSGGANTDTIYSGVISGTGSLVKTGSGTLTLAASNTYSGNTTVSGGTLKFGANNIFQYGVGQGDITVNGTLDLNGRTLNNGRINGLKGSGTVTNSSATAAYLTVGYGDASSTFSGSLMDGAGTVALAKTGAGILTLSGNSNYTGTTTITQGTLSVSNLAAGGNLGSGSGALVLGDSANAGVLFYTGTTASFSRGFTVNASGGEIDTTTAGQTLTLSTGNVATGGAFTIGGAGNTSITSNITGAGSLNKTGAGILTLSGANTYSGATNIKNGTVVLAVNDSGLKSTTTLTLGDATLNTNGVLKLDGHTQTLAGLSVAGSGTGNRVTGGNAALSTLTLNNAGANTFAGILGGTGTNDNGLALVKTGAGTLTLAGTNTFTGGATVTAGTLSISRDNNLGGTSGGVILNGGTLSANASFTLGSGRSVLLGPASGSGSGTLDVTTGNTLTYAGVLASNGSGTGSLIKTSPGTLILSGTSSYGGSTTIKDGTLSLAISNALPTGTSLTLGASTTGGILKLNGKNQVLADLAAFGGGTNRIVNGNLTSSTLTLNIAGTSAYSAYLGGTGTNDNNFSLTKTGLGTLTLSGANTYAGNTTVSAGTLKISSSVTLPSGAGKGNLVLNGTLDLSTYGITVNGLSGAGTITTSAVDTPTLSVGSNDQSSTFDGIIENGAGTLALTKTGTGTLTLTGANTYGGVTTILTGGTLKVGRSDAIPFGTGRSTVAVTGTLDLNANSITLNGLTSNGTVLSNAAGAVTLSLGAADTSASFSGIIRDGNSGTIALTKIGTGTIMLAGASTYSGNTTISEGTLKLNGTSAIPSGTGKGNVSIAAGSFLDLNARNNTINGLTGPGTITNSGTGAATLTAGANNQTSTFEGLIQDGTSTLALGKTGSGTLTLTGNNSFTGGVTISGGSGVNAGVLQIGSDGALNSTTPNTVAFGSNVLAGTKLQLNGHSITLGGLTTSSTVGSPVVENASATAVALTISNAAANTYGGVIQDGTGGGALSLVKTNSGVLSLAAFNTYTGTTTILQGTILTGGDGAFGAVPASATAGNIVLNGTLANPAILSLNGNSIINSNRGIALGPASGSGLGTLDVTATKTLTYAGILADNGGTGGLVKTGLGTLALTGAANSYSGGTTVSSGLINITGGSGTPLGANINTNNIAVNAGGNLSLSNTSNKGSNQTITVTSSASALGGIGFSNAALTKTQLAGMFTDNTGSYGGVLGLTPPTAPRWT
ncbi:MAG: autotransporter-associated beta strand repeat-containing protein [Verrucomicrobia bacterium]|nr:autotransporter-associated beta strand repeat-containing protein [Verrucomicrobiota bacterium]